MMTTPAQLRINDKRAEEQRKVKVLLDSQKYTSKLSCAPVSNGSM